MELPQKYAIVYADKCSNNVVIMCKKHYLACVIKEWNINNHHQDSNTYNKVDVPKTKMIEKHLNYMNRNKIKVQEKHMKLPNFYMIPKMHKPIPKERYLAASHACTTKTLSSIITKCLKLVNVQHKKYCNKIYEYTGVNRMWVIDNSSNVLDKIQEFTNDQNVRNVNSYDFSTLYTKIRHKDLKEKITWVINKPFNNTSKKVMFVNNVKAT